MEYDIYKGTMNDMREGTGNLLYAKCGVDVVKSFCSDYNILSLADFLDGAYTPSGDFKYGYWLQEAI